MPLDELRRARQMTQARLAESQGVNQGEKLEIRAVFKDGEVRITQFEQLQ
jgi:hypothetical protein